MSFSRNIKFEVPVSEITKTISGEIRVSGLAFFKFRINFFIFLIRLVAKVCPVKMDISLKDNS